jgi:hypothetical protein
MNLFCDQTRGANWPSTAMSDEATTSQDKFKRLWKEKTANLSGLRLFTEPLKRVRGRLSLTRLEAWILLVDDIKATFAADYAAVTVTNFQCFQ